MNSLQPYQLRVIAERTALGSKLSKLLVFLGSPTFKDLSEAEQERLSKQAGFMRQYSEILGERIEAFSQRSEINELEDVAGELYEVYGKEVGGVAFNGDPLPDWAEFSVAKRALTFGTRL